MKDSVTQKGGERIEQNAGLDIETLKLIAVILTVAGSSFSFFYNLLDRTLSPQFTNILSAILAVLIAYFTGMAFKNKIKHS